MKYAAGNIEKVHVLRIQPGEDVLNCIQAYCDQHHILNGVILSGIGSLDGCTFFDPQEIPGKPGCYGYVTAINLPTPLFALSLPARLPLIFMPALPTRMAMNMAAI